MVCKCTKFLKVWKLTFTTLGELHSVLLFLLRTCVYCLMGDTPMDIKLMHACTHLNDQDRPDVAKQLNLADAL